VTKEMTRDQDLKKRSLDLCIAFAATALADSITNHKVEQKPLQW